MNDLSMKTPGVYIQEINAFPNSVVAVPTAIPVFIGYTQKASYNNMNLVGKPIQINSPLDYETIFGKGFPPKFNLASATSADVKSYPDRIVFVNDTNWLITPVEHTTAYLYNSIRLFYQNGGGTCYIHSLGTYDGQDELVIRPGDFGNEAVFNALKQQPDITLIVMPDLIRTGARAYPVYDQVLAHCADTQSRFAIFDLACKTANGSTATTDVVNEFRAGTGVNALNYGAAYYPWLQTTIIQETELSPDQFDMNQLMQLVQEPKALEILRQYAAATPAQRPQLNNELKVASKSFSTLVRITCAIMNILPASGAMAGIYTSVDNNRGVWKAPANVSLAGVTGPVVKLSSMDQEGLNTDAATGKSINVIRYFTGEGTLVWGARTLDGNSQDWRYISVRRTVMMIEQSIKQALLSYVFEPNDSNTWVAVKSMLNNFLTSVWKEGGLVGAKPEDAFSVTVGLGSTMTAEDILEGLLKVTVLVAITRPAEFIVITVAQQMQKS